MQKVVVVVIINRRCVFDRVAVRTQPLLFVSLFILFSSIAEHIRGPCFLTETQPLSIIDSKQGKEGKEDGGLQ